MSQSYETILVERRDRVATITINRPEKRNALNIQTRAEGAAVLDELRDDDSIRVVIFTGAGDKAFIAGADIAEFAGRTALSQRAIMLERGLFNAIDTFPKPVIAMVNGYCLGGGCELALACDIRIASETASFGQPEINLGIIPGGGGTQRLTRLVGEGKAMEMILTGEIINAQEAFRIGLVNRVVPADELAAKTMEVANRIAEKSPIALRLAKEAVKLASRSNLDEGLRREVDLFALCFSSEDKDEGVNAFLEKGKPTSRGSERSLANGRANVCGNMTSDLQKKRWAVLSSRGCEADDLTHEEARRLVHKLASEGHHGLCIVTSEAARKLSRERSMAEQLR